MRPLRALEREGIELTVVPCSREGFLDPTEIQKAIRKNSRMVVLNHGSNVVGTLLPLEPVGEICRNHGILFMVDAAQTAGVIPIDVEKEKIDLLAFTGHKALFGPQGTGGLVIGRRVDEKNPSTTEKRGHGESVRVRRAAGFSPRPLRKRNAKCRRFSRASGRPWILSWESARKNPDP